MQGLNSWPSDQESEPARCPSLWFLFCISLKIGDVEHLFMCLLAIYLKFFFNVYLFLRERERQRQSTSRGGAEREGDTESEAGSRLCAVSTEPDVRLKLMNRKIMTWAKVRHVTDWATQAPYLFIFKCLFIFGRERMRMSGAGAEKEGGQGSEAGSVLTAESPMRGSNSRTMRLWPKPKSDA